MTQSGLTLSGDVPPEDSMDVDEDARMPDGREDVGMPALSLAEERILARESTASFAGTISPDSIRLNLLMSVCVGRLGHFTFPTNPRCL